MIKFGKNLRICEQSSLIRTGQNLLRVEFDKNRIENARFSGIKPDHFQIQPLQKKKGRPG
jgi:hypothetical protein